MSKSLDWIKNVQTKKKEEGNPQSEVYTSGKQASWPEAENRRLLASLGALLTINLEEVVQVHQTQRRFLNCFWSTV